MILKLLLVFNLITLSYSQEKSITLTTPYGDVIPKISHEVLKKAYVKLGIKVVAKYEPGERAIVSADSGAFDGVLGRINHIEKRYRNLIRIPIPINDFEIAVFSPDKNLKINGWQSLKEYKLLIRLGIKGIEKVVKKGFQYKKLNNVEQLYKMLGSGRFKAGVYVLEEGIYYLKKNQVNNVYLIKPSLDKVKLYHYLHEKNLSLKEPITKVLLDMEKSGEIKKIKERVIKELLQ